MRDPERTGQVVADEEDRAAALAGVVVLDHVAEEVQRVGVAVVIDRAAAATARRVLRFRVSSPADGAVVGQPGVVDVPGDADAAERAAVRANSAGEGAV